METNRIPRTRARQNYHVLADALREQILSGTIPEGAVLPNERELGGRTGLGRSSVREALRVLEVEGLLATKRGRNGGSTTMRPGSAALSRSLTSFVRGQQVPFDAVLEAREALEPVLAALAAQNCSEADLEAIAAASAEMAAAGADNSRFLAANSRWHFAVARASHNPVLIAMVSAVGDLLHASNIERFVSADVRRAVIRAHGGIESAIRAGDADAARRRMSRHVHSYRVQVTPVAPRTVGMPVP